MPRARWALRALLLFALAFTNLSDIWSPDVVPNTLLVWTLASEGDADFDEFTQIPRDSYFFRPCRAVAGAPQDEPYFSTSPRSPGGPPPPGPDDRVCSIFPPGISLLAFPVLAPFVLAGVPASDGATLIRAGHLAAALIEVIAALLLWAVTRRFTSDRWALVLVLLYWLGTSVRTVAAQALWQHAGVHLAVALALWLVLHERPPSWRRELLAGLALGFGIVARQTAAVPALLAARVRAPWPAAAALGAGVAAGAMPLFIYQQLAFGSALETGYGPKPFDTPVATGLYGLLLSPSRGLLVYEPWALAGLAALALSWFRSGHVAQRLRGLSLAWLATLALYASYAEWWGGRVFGPRFLDDLAPVLVVAAAWGIGQGTLRRVWARLAFALAAAWSLVLFNAAALVYDPAGWDTVPVNVNFEPSRLLDWADPQWLAVLRSPEWGEPRVLAAALLSALVVALLLRIELRGTEGPPPTLR